MSVCEIIGKSQQENWLTPEQDTYLKLEKKLETPNFNPKISIQKFTSSRLCWKFKSDFSIRKERENCSLDSRESYRKSGDLPNRKFFSLPKMP